jgi:hypothetical protein
MLSRPHTAGIGGLPSGRSLARVTNMITCASGFEICDGCRPWLQRIRTNAQRRRDESSHSMAHRHATAHRVPPVRARVHAVGPTDPIRGASRTDRPPVHGRSMRYCAMRPSAVAAVRPIGGALCGIVPCGRPPLRRCGPPAARDIAPPATVHRRQAPPAVRPRQTPRQAPYGGAPYGGVPCGGAPYGGVPCGGAPCGGAPCGGAPCDLSPRPLGHGTCAVRSLTTGAFLLQCSEWYCDNVVQPAHQSVT